MSRIQDGLIQGIDPRTGNETVAVPCTPVEDIPSQIQQARTAQAEWADTPLRDRKAAIAALRSAFLGQAEQVATLLAEECGRPAGEAWTAEIVANDELFGFWLGAIDDLLTATPVSLNPINYPGKRCVVRLEARGLISLITPWNLPVAIPLRTLVPALLAGNGVIWKPSEHTPRISALLSTLCDAHLPAGLVTLVQGGASQGEAVISPAVDTVFFTGSVKTGRHVQGLAAQAGIPAALELGGKDAALVLSDANLERAADGITWAAFGFSGQNCASVERCFVHADVFDAFLQAVIERTEKLRPMIDVGPLVTEAQLHIVKRHVAEARDQGATIHVGGTANGPGNHHAPTVLTGVTSDMAIFSEETFGPVLPIVSFDDVETAIEDINSTRFGLTTSIWTQDRELGESMADRFDCGVVTVNNHSFTGALAGAAWGGVKDSGHGVTNSRFALYEMTRPKTVLVDASGQREMWWYPYNDALLTVTRNLVELSQGGTNRLAALFKLISGLLNRWKESP